MVGEPGGSGVGVRLSYPGRLSDASTDYAWVAIPGGKPVPVSPASSPTPLTPRGWPLSVSPSEPLSPGPALSVL